MLEGSWMAEGVNGRWMPLVAKLMARLVVSMNVGMAERRGCWRPRPPVDSDRVARM